MNQLTKLPIQGEVLDDCSTVRVVGTLHPFRNGGKDRISISVQAGLSIAEIIDKILASQAGPLRVAPLMIRVGHSPVPRDRWKFVRPKAGSIVTFRPYVNDNALRTVGMLAVTVAALFAAPFLAPGLISALGTFGIAIGTQTAIGIAGAALAVSGSLAFNYLFPVRPPQIASPNGREAPQRYSIAGSRNSALPRQPLPWVLGRCRMYGPLLAPSYTELVGDDQYVNILVTWGYGRVAISNYKIGETPITSFGDYTIEQKFGIAGQSPVSQFRKTVVEEGLTVELRSANDWEVRNTEPGIDGFSFDITAPEGAYQVDPDTGKREDYKVVVESRYRDLAGGGYVNLPDITFTRDIGVMRRGHQVNGLDGQYEISVRKATADNDYEYVHETVMWTALRSIFNEDPDQFPIPIAKTALRIKATEQLNGTVDTFNAIITSQVLAFNGSIWVANTSSSNPADLFRHVLQGPGNVRPVTNAELDLDSIEGWWSYCRSKGFECNMVISGRKSVAEVLDDIAATGRAAVSKINGKWGVIWDQPDSEIVDILSPRNSWGFSCSRIYTIKPHGFMANFINEEIGFQDDQRIVYDDGFDESNSSLFETFEVPGVTNPALMYKHARFQIAQKRLRPEIITLMVPWGFVAWTRGDRVRLQHDVLLIGQMSGRVKAVADPVVTLDEDVIMEAGKGYGLRYRQNDGTQVFRRVYTIEGEGNTVTLSDDTPGAVPDVGAFFTFGEWDGAARDSGIYRINAINPGDDLNAMVELVDDAPAISLADSGVIPDFETNISPPIDFFSLPPTDLRLSEAITGRGLNARASVTLSWQVPRIGKIVNFRIQRRDDTAEGPWQQAGSVTAPDTQIRLEDIPTGTHSFRVRAEFADGEFSSWTSLININIHALLLVPRDVTNFRISVLGETSQLEWDIDDTPNLNGYELRFSSTSDGSATWNASTLLVPLISGHNVQVPTRTGTYFIKAVTAQGVYSENAAEIISLIESTNRNVVVVLQQDPDFTGTHDNTTVVSSLLRLDSANTISTWDHISNVTSLSLGTADTVSIVSSGTYYFSEGLDLGDVYTSRLNVAISAFAISLGEDMFNPEDFFDPLDFFGEANTNDWSVVVEVRTTNEDPFGVIDPEDAYTKILLHFDGADLATTFTDSAPTPNTFSAVGNAKLKTATKVFGTASGYFDGTGDAITCADNAAFTLGSGDFTVDCWFNCEGATGTGGYLFGHENGTSDIAIRAFRNGASDTIEVMGFASSGAITVFDIIGTTPFSNAANIGWHHFALVRNGGTVSLYINGILEGSDAAVGITAIDNAAQPFNVGARTAAGINSWNGYIDEFRLSVGIARWTANFTPPSSQYIHYADPDWSDWAPVIAGDYVARAFDTPRVLLRSFRTDITPAIEKLSLTIDMPDRLFEGDDIVLDAAGTNIVFDPPFKEIKSLNVTVQNLSSGDRLEVTNKSVSGATLRVFNSGGTGVSRVADYLATGYGKTTS